MTKLIFGEGDELEVDSSQIIFSYPYQRGVEDKILQYMEQWMEGYRPEWVELPVIITTNLFVKMSEYAKSRESDADEIVKLISKQIMSVWNEYVGWREYVMETLPSEEQMFVTERKIGTIWVIDNGSAITMLLPDDY